MNTSRIASRIWSDLTSLVLPLVAIAAYVFDRSSTVTTVLMALALAGIFGPWVADRGWRRWRVRIVRLLARARSRVGDG